MARRSGAQAQEAGRLEAAETTPLDRGRELERFEIEEGDVAVQVGEPLGFVFQRVVGAEEKAGAIGALR